MCHHVGLHTGLSACSTPACRAQGSMLCRHPPSINARQQLLCHLLPTLTVLRPAMLLRTNETMSSAETGVRFINILPDTLLSSALFP